MTVKEARMEDLTPEESVWMELLRRDSDLAAMNEVQKRTRLKEAGFPAVFIDTFLGFRQ